MYERTRRLTHDDYENKFSYLLETNNEVTFHAKNNLKLTIEVHKYLNVLSNLSQKLLSINIPQNPCEPIWLRKCNLCWVCKELLNKGKFRGFPRTVLEGFASVNFLSSILHMREKLAKQTTNLEVISSWSIFIGIVIILVWSTVYKE